ncbi:hypothetical protein [Mastigocladopsis repens]|nr:hypothetical protein [Mastigocladopsis repens]
MVLFWFVGDWSYCNSESLFDASWEAITLQAIASTAVTFATYEL